MRTFSKTFRVHFSDSKQIEDSYDEGQGQQSQGISGRITNRGDWNLAKCVINQSTIRWALGTCGNRWNCAGTSAARDGPLSPTPVPHIQSLHGLWIYPYGLEASKGDVYSKARET
jgi:hypothetical protein